MLIQQIIIINKLIHPPKMTQSQLIVLVALLDLIVHSLIALPPNLGLEIKIHNLVLLGLPLAVGIAIVHNLAAPGVLDLDRRVGERPVRGPLEPVARTLFDGERLGAANVSVAVDAFFHGEIEDVAFGDGIAG